jgi:toprim domain protein
MEEQDRVIIVEGKTDRERLRRVLAELVPIFCTYGTYSTNKAEQLAVKIDPAAEVYIFTDEDDSGRKLRALLREDFPDAIHLYTNKEFAQVANTPDDVLAEILAEAGFAVRT